MTVSPALVVPMPVVSTARGLSCAAYFRNCDFAVPGSPRRRRWLSPRMRVPAFSIMTPPMMVMARLSLTRYSPNTCARDAMIRGNARRRRQGAASTEPLPPRAVLKGGRNERPRGRSLLRGQDMDTTEAALNNGWRLAAVVGEWRLAVGGRWRLAVGGERRLVVGGWWSLQR